MRNLKSFLANLSNKPGVYQMLGSKGEVLYVGKAKNLKKRISSYFSGRAQDPKTLSLVKHIDDVVITVTGSENEAVLLECNLIKTHKPYYNVLLRDDKSYPYIFISSHKFPRIDVFRGTRKKNGQYFGPYPSSLAVRETINLLQKIFKLRTCRDSYYNARTRPCLLYQIERCSGPCVGLISSDDYAQNVKMAEYFLRGKSDEVIESLQSQMEDASAVTDYERAAELRDQIARLRKIQEKQYVNMMSGEADAIGLAVHAGVVCLQLLSVRNGQVLASRTYYPKVPADSADDEILEAFIAQHYVSAAAYKENVPRQILVSGDIPDTDVLASALSEQAGHKVEILRPVRGDRKKWLDMAAVSAKESLAAQLLSKANMQERISALRVALGLRKMPERIECFDISHSMGEATVASCVVFDRDGPVKSAYRRYNITGITPGDDVAAMHQVMLRRFKGTQKNNSVLPDIILVDGGKAQLAAASKALGQCNIINVLMVGVSKGPDRKPGFEVLHFVDRSPVHLPASSIALHLIQQVRDEAHRFAITGHRLRRGKARTQSVLETIPGIGAKKRRELLRFFGGIQGISCASLDELMKVPGISKSLAERIFATLHDTNI